MNSTEPGSNASSREHLGDTGELEAVGDLPLEELRTGLLRVVDLIVAYQRGVGERPVLPAVAAGEVTAMLPVSPPSAGESLQRILDDYEQVIEPAMTHWNHPGFLAYFGVSGSAPGILAEALTASLNVNAMLWRTSPAATELELRVCDWLRQMLDLPDAFRGHINDTASISTLLALAAARDRALGEQGRAAGLAGEPPLTVYASDQAHSSVDKAVLALGLGLDHLRRLPSDDEYRLRSDALERAIARDRAAGCRPLAVVATLGTTSTTSLDPVAEMARVARREGLWLHVDAAYGGAAAICPELRSGFDGWEQADSIVVNPHKWLFTPIDCSVLFTRGYDVLRSTFSVVPDYLKTGDDDVVNLMDLGVQLGRRFRALKLWMVIRAFGVDGMRERIRYHCWLARKAARWVDDEPGFERLAPVPFSVVCFRAVTGGALEDDNRLNERLLREVNSAGPVFLSHTVLQGRYTLRIAVGNLKTEESHLCEAWRLLCAARRKLVQA